MDNRWSIQQITMRYFYFCRWKCPFPCEWLVSSPLCPRLFFVAQDHARPSLWIHVITVQLQIKWEPSNFNTIYSLKINYRGPNVGICSKPFNLAAARKEIHSFIDMLNSVPWKRIQDRPHWHFVFLNLQLVRAVDAQAAGTVSASVATNLADWPRVRVDRGRTPGTRVWPMEVITETWLPSKSMEFNVSRYN